jgi:hypothetical protein
MTRTGKIARLPQTLREQLNRRLQDGEPGKRLVDWLNALPEVQVVMASEFGSQPVSKQNLSEWKTGGYAEWEAQQQACGVVQRLVEQSSGLRDTAGGGALSERLSVVLLVELARQLPELLAETTEPAERFSILQQGLEKLAQLRREESNAGRLQLEQERWEARQKTEATKAAVNRPLFPIQAALLQYSFHQLMVGASPTAQAVVLQTLERLGDKQRRVSTPANPTPPDPLKPIKGNSSEATRSDQSESDQIKPNQTKNKATA